MAKTDRAQPGSSEPPRRRFTLAREFYRDGQYHDIVIYSTFKESSESMSHV